MIKKDCIAVILTFCLLLTTVSCKKEQIPAPSGAQAPATQLKPLDQLLAPIALYPDALLAQVLASATSPQQVTVVNNWLQQNTQLHGTELQDAANQQGFDASFVALALFPDVLKMMAANIDWTTELGTAFLSDQKSVMDSVQNLRAQAQAVGNLKTTPQQEVNTESKDGQKVIVIQPANPQVVYVPVYNTQTVYTSPPPATPSATTSSSSSGDSGKTAAAALIGFGLGIAIGASMNNNYYAPYGYGAWGMGWHTNTVIVTGGAWRVPPYARYPYTRPVPYGSYHPPANVYAPRYSNVNVNVNNVNVNRNAYSGGSTPPPQPYTRTARPAATTSATRTATMPASAPTTTSGARPATTQAARPTTAPSSRPAARPATTSQRAAPTSSARSSDYSSRGYSQSSSQVPSNTRPAERAQTSSSAFSGYQSGSAERTASQRGQSSVSGSQGRARAPRK
jgi:hypothetical protein